MIILSLARPARPALKFLQVMTSWEYTIMTYHAYAGAPDYIVANRSDAGSYAQSLMMDDIQAIRTSVWRQLQHQQR